MKTLKFEQWKPYFWNSEMDKFNGVKFEDLVAELLDLEYPPARAGENWHRTEQSWDGKRDFYQEFTEGGKSLLRWAECKAYRNALSLNILAPTLIMGTLHNTDEIIFFSYSRLNREAVRELQQFAAVSHKRIRIYDDDRLEQLIFRYKDHEKFHFSTFFPHADDFLPEDTEDFPISYDADAYVYRQNASYRMQELKTCKLMVNELLELRIALVNHSLDPQRITLKFDMTQNDVYRFLDAENRELQIAKEITLQGGEALSVPFPFKITGFAKRICLPEVSFTWKGKTRSFEPGFFLGRWLLETPYLGDMEQLEAFSETTMRHYNTACAVFGPSGAGKTRYLREIQSRRYMAGRKCLWSDAVHADGNVLVWLKQVLSTLYSLPLIRVKSYEPGKFPDVENRVIADVLYSPDFRLDDAAAEQLCMAILKALQDQNILLIVDNVQDFDSDTVRMLNSLLNLISGQPGAHLLFSFNTDLLFRQETASALLQRFKQLERSDPDHYCVYQIKGLREGDDELFIRSCFSSGFDTGSDTALAWRPILQQIASSAQRNPLYLEQCLLYLRENSVLKAESDHLYVFNNHSLPEYLTDLPASTEELLASRWELLRKNADLPREELEKALRFLCFFTEIPQELIRELDLDADAVDLLIGAGFLRQESGLTFYHPLVDKYFRRKYASLTQSDIELCLKALTSTGLKESHPGQFYICVLQRRPVPAEQVDAAIDTLIAGKVPTPLLQTYGDTLFSALSGGGYLLSENTEKLLRFYIAYCEQQKQYRPLSEVLKVYTDVYENCLTKFSEFRIFGEAYFQFVKEYMNALLSEHHSTEVVKLGNALSKDICKYTFDSPRKAEQAKAILYNRMHVAYDRLEPPVAGVPDSPHARELLSAALEISYQIKNPDGIIQNEIDFGNIFYLFGGPIKSAAEHWQLAYTQWKANAAAVPLWEGGVYYHKALAHTVLHQWEDAEQALQQVFHFHGRTLHNPYFYVKALTLHAILQLIAEKPFKDVLRAINDAEDACTQGGFKGIFPVCSHARALAYDLLSENREIAADYYEKALIQYIDRCECAQEEERNLPTMLSLALALRRLRKYASYPSIARLKSRDAAGKLLRILEADDSQWQAIGSEPVPEGPLYFESRGINYPCV